MSFGRRALGGLAAGFDAFIHRAVLNRPQRGSVEGELGPIERVNALRVLADEIRVDHHVEKPEIFFPPVPEVLLHEVSVRRTDWAHLVDWRFPSEPPLFFEQVAERRARYSDNKRGHARFIGAGPAPGKRPVVLLVHGYLGGDVRVEERVWPLKWLLRIGLDVVLATLPFHGVRRRGRAMPPFPAADPRFTIEGFRQAMTDLRVLVRHCRAAGSVAVGAMGMSLGGYNSALLATVEPLDFVVPFIPLASIPDFATEGNRFVGTATQRREQFEWLEHVYRVVSPLARPPRVPQSGRLVVAGRTDRITPISHAERIATHFDAPLSIFEGGHLLQVGRETAFRDFAKMMGGHGWLAPR